jgi:hypothetical protein
VIARIALASLAVVVLGWLAVMERDNQLLTRGLRGWKALPASQAVPCASALGAPGHDCRAYARVKADLRGARLLSPDSTPQLLSGMLEGSGRWRAQAAVIERVLRREPENLVAWKLLLSVTRGHDATASGRAQGAIRRLDPINSQSR